VIAINTNYYFETWNTSQCVSAEEKEPTTLRGSIVLLNQYHSVEENEYLSGLSKQDMTV